MFSSCFAASSLGAACCDVSSAVSTSCPSPSSSTSACPEPAPAELRRQAAWRLSRPSRPFLRSSCCRRTSTLLRNCASPSWISLVRDTSSETSRLIREGVTPSGSETLEALRSCSIASREYTSFCTDLAPPPAPFFGGGSAAQRTAPSGRVGLSRMLWPSTSFMSHTAASRDTVISAGLKEVADLPVSGLSSTTCRSFGRMPSRGWPGGMAITSTTDSTSPEAGAAMNATSSTERRPLPTSTSSTGPSAAAAARAVDATWSRKEHHFSWPARRPQTMPPLPHGSLSPSESRAGTEMISLRTTTGLRKRR
mmetsp:Transcript_14411/g.38022  ORF Transcript_14411/g.38022 Transcript_14411/m.38022 type:complete len:309 (+) Transcript_14411:672-1598(+)